ncbi:MAG TPA: hypothetical protein VF576_01970 [Rubricoccaceae bacterium]|jgi:hypothetical protein
MRLALPAALALTLLPTSQVSAQAPVLVASRAPGAHAPRPSAGPAVAHVSLTSAPGRPPRPAARVEVGITAAWPSGPDGYTDADSHEIEAGTVDGDLFVRWYPFDAHPRSFSVEVSVGGRPFETVVTVAASQAGAEYGVHLVGLAPGLYGVRMREHGADGATVVSAPIHVRV